MVCTCNVPWGAGGHVKRGHHQTSCRVGVMRGVCGRSWGNEGPSGEGQSDHPCGRGRAGQCPLRHRGGQPKGLWAWQWGLGHGTHDVGHGMKARSCGTSIPPYDIVCGLGNHWPCWPSVISSGNALPPSANTGSWGVLSAHLNRPTHGPWQGTTTSHVPHTLCLLRTQTACLALTCKKAFECATAAALQGPKTPYHSGAPALYSRCGRLYPLMHVHGNVPSTGLLLRA